MTGQLNKDNGLQGRWTRTTGYNTGLAKVAVQCSADTFVVNQSLVLRINICGENRHLRQVKIATFAKPETVMPHAMTKQRITIKQ